MLVELSNVTTLSGGGVAKPKDISLKAFNQPFVFREGSFISTVFTENLFQCLRVPVSIENSFINSLTNEQKSERVCDEQNKASLLVESHLRVF